MIGQPRGGVNNFLRMICHHVRVSMFCWLFLIFPMAMVFWWKVIFLSGVVKAVRSKSRYLNNGRVESAVAMQESVEDATSFAVMSYSYWDEGEVGVLDFFYHAIW